MTSISISTVGAVGIEPTQPRSQSPKVTDATQVRLPLPTLSFGNLTRPHFRQNVD